MPGGDWFRAEGDQVRLWGGWHGAAGHHWFLAAAGDLDRARIAGPFGKDTIRAIDHPVVEQGGGLYWSRIPDDAVVVGSRLAGVDTAYPMTVLEKVLVVNDLVNEQPFLVITLPQVRGVERTVAYDPVFDGQRLTLGLSGYFQDGKPVLYDRGTESLWLGEPEGLLAITGKHKGHRLPRVLALVPATWSDWRSRHPASRLVVGADRSKDMPAL
jgi:hypothetical protein